MNSQRPQDVPDGVCERISLVRPDADNLAGYEEGLARGWSPDPRKEGDEALIANRLARLRDDRLAYLADMLQTTFVPPASDGTSVAALQNKLFFIWDGAFCGTASVRYDPETDDLPSTIPGHIGYSVVKWKQGNGYATAALRLLCAIAKADGLSNLLILCNVSNVASRRVIERNGGKLIKTGPHPSDGPEQIKLYFDLRLDR